MNRLITLLLAGLLLLPVPALATDREDLQELDILYRQYAVILLWQKHIKEQSLLDFTAADTESELKVPVVVALSPEEQYFMVKALDLVLERLNKRAGELFLSGGCNEARD